MADCNVLCPVCVYTAASGLPVVSAHPLEPFFMLFLHENMSLRPITATLGTICPDFEPVETFYNGVLITREEIASNSLSCSQARHGCVIGA